MNILVTGGSGFIGSHFIEEFLKRNDVTNVYNLDMIIKAEECAEKLDIGYKKRESLTLFFFILLG